MTDHDWNYLKRKRSRLEQLGTLNPFCCICGEHLWCVRYDLHHFARRKYDDRVIRLCVTCHNKVSDMEKEFAPIPANTEPRLAKIIAQIRGRIILFRLSLSVDEELERWLTGAQLLPPSADNQEADANV